MQFSELEGSDFITKYLAYTSGSEVPTFFNRWACLVGIGAWAKQDIWIQFGENKVYPNMYALLIGDPGTRKSTAIKQMKRFLQEVGYNYFSSEKTSKEMFLEDLAEEASEKLSLSERVDEVLWGNQVEGVSPILIAADEFNDFFSNNIYEFVSTLGVLWDYVGEYRSKVKHGKSPVIQNPNVSILGGNTITSLCRAFTPEMLGQGFFSRVIFVYGKPNGVLVPFPKVPKQEELDYLKEEFLKMRKYVRGEIKYTDKAKSMLEKIYREFKGIDDGRFLYYKGRRFMHLLKLVQIHTIADYCSVADVIHVQRAHTVLVHTEHFMPKAMGEFGRAKNSAVTHRVLEIIEASHTAMGFSELWAQINGELEDTAALLEIIKNLATAQKIQISNGSYLPMKKVKEEPEGYLYDWSYLTNEERGIE